MHETRPLGVTLSSWSGDVDFTRMSAAGISFVSIRTTIGGTGQDERWKEYWDDAGKAGLLRQAFHFLKSQESAPPFEQAGHFLEVSPPGDLPPLIDVETNDVTEWDVHKFASKVWLELIFPPTIYTRKNIWDMLSSGVLWPARHHLAIAAYQEEEPALPDPWRQWTYWQYTDSADGEPYGVMGNTAVLNLFNGSLQRLFEISNGYRAARWLGKSNPSVWDMIMNALP